MSSAVLMLLRLGGRPHPFLGFLTIFGNRSNRYIRDISASFNERIPFKPTSKRKINFRNKKKYKKNLFLKLHVQSICIQIGNKPMYDFHKNGQRKI